MSRIHILFKRPIYPHDPNITLSNILELTQQIISIIQALNITTIKMVKEFTQTKLQESMINCIPLAIT